MSSSRNGSSASSARAGSSVSSARRVINGWWSRNPEIQLDQAPVPSSGATKNRNNSANTGSSSTNTRTESKGNKPQTKLSKSTTQLGESHRGELKANDSKEVDNHPLSLICPVTKQLFKTPAALVTGHSVEESEAPKLTHCPVTNKKLEGIKDSFIQYDAKNSPTITKFVRNLELCKLVEAYTKKTEALNNEIKENREKTDRNQTEGKAIDSKIQFSESEIRVVTSKISEISKTLGESYSLPLHSTSSLPQRQQSETKDIKPETKESSATAELNSQIQAEFETECNESKKNQGVRYFEVKCTISQFPIEEPVIVSTGDSYEEEEFAGWVASLVGEEKPVTNPLSGIRIDPFCKPNVTLKNAIEEAELSIDSKIRFMLIPSREELEESTKKLKQLRQKHKTIEAKLQQLKSTLTQYEFKLRLSKMSEADRNRELKLEEVSKQNGELKEALQAREQQIVTLLQTQQSQAQQISQLTHLVAAQSEQHAKQFAELKQLMIDSRQSQTPVESKRSPLGITDNKQQGSPRSTVAPRLFGHHSAPSRSTSRASSRNSSPVRVPAGSFSEFRERAQMQEGPEPGTGLVPSLGRCRTCC